MARSYKKHPCFCWCGGSNKWWKGHANKCYRMAVKKAIRRGDELFPLRREVTNIWDSSKDGKAHWHTLHDLQEWATRDGLTLNQIMGK